MNRQQRRRRGQDDELVLADDAEAQVARHLAEEQSAAGSSAPRSPRVSVEPTRHRVAPRQFLHEVNVEMRKVAWPTRAETINYSTVVFVTLAILMAFIFGLDLVFSKAAGFLFNP